MVNQIKELMVGTLLSKQKIHMSTMYSTRLDRTRNSIGNMKIDSFIITALSDKELSSKRHRCLLGIVYWVPPAGLDTAK